MKLIAKITATIGAIIAVITLISSFDSYHKRFALSQELQDTMSAIRKDESIIRVLELKYEIRDKYDQLLDLTKIKRSSKSGSREEQDVNIRLEKIRKEIDAIDDEIKNKNK